jgi:protein SCO1
MAGKIWIVTAVLLLILGVVITLRSVPNTPSPVKMVLPVAGSSVGGAFELLDQNRRTVTDKTYDGKFRLVFFGFTSCPSVCPTELQRISEVLLALGKKADQIAPIFITIDPERDTPATMKEYLTHFDDRFIGLSGSPDAIKKTIESYKVYASKVDQGQGDYMMDHSAYIYLMNGNDQLVALFRSSDSVADITKKINALLP